MSSSPNLSQLLAKELSLPLAGVARTLQLLDSGATVPFIARYRKEATGGLDDEAIARIASQAKVVEARESRRSTILSSLREQGVLTAALEQSVVRAATLAELEDLYLPYRPKRRTRAQQARERGLTPLAEALLQQSRDTSVQEMATGFVDPERQLPDVEAVLAGARDIMAEVIAEKAPLRQELRGLFTSQGELSVKVARGKSKSPELARFQDHLDRRERAEQAPSHRVLAVERGEKEGLLQVAVELPREEVQRRVARQVVRPGASPEVSRQISLAIDEAIDRLLVPSLESEYRRRLKARADEEAIRVFAQNLSALLLAAPLGPQPVVAIDPGLRTGCKVVALDGRGELLEQLTIYPHTGKESEAGAALAAVVKRRAPVAIAIGNGTAGRETEQFVRTLVSSGLIPHSVRVLSVSEAGASVYSASEVAREELPDVDVSLRGAVSIGRRLQDPLAELVKLDPKSIGVGQYQHDVDQGALSEALDRVVETVVNKVGVDLNTASATLLRYIAGLGPALAAAVVQHRQKHGAFQTRSQLKEVPRLGARAFEQCAGFLRIRDGKEALDASAVHPERYAIVARMAKDLGVARGELVGNESVAGRVDISRYVDDAAGVGLPTLQDIVAELKKPGRDPRAEFSEVGFAPDITELEHVKVGQVLNGVVTNVAAFGAFVDIGVHQDGLVHVSELAHRFIKDPAEVVKVGDRVKVKVLQVDPARRRIGLSIKALTSAPASASNPGRTPFNAPRTRGP